MYIYIKQDTYKVMVLYMPQSVTWQSDGLSQNWTLEKKRDPHTMEQYWVQV